MQPPDETDVVVVGSGGAGLLAACVAADAGARVTLLERSPLLGGTTAISGGGLWVPDNPKMRALGLPDSRQDALTYLRRLTLGEVDGSLLEAFVDNAPAMVVYLERATPLRFFVVDRPDYYPTWPGASQHGRALEVEPYAANELGDQIQRVRFSVTRAPVTSVEGRAGLPPETIEKRRTAGIRTQGAGLAAGLVKACLDRGTSLLTSQRVTGLLSERGRVAGVVADGGSGPRALRAWKAVILASGGFEWNAAMKRTFLKSVDTAPLTPPWNEGDGILIALRLGAALANMTEALWAPSIQVPGEAYDGRPLSRNVVRELALPGSILVNRRGVRFVNESIGYNDLGKTFHVFDPTRYELANVPAWLVFDAAFKGRYTVATIPPGQPAPGWFLAHDDLGGLAALAGIDPTGLQQTVTAFNGYAAAGQDPDFGRGETRHQEFNGDASHRPNPCLGPLVEPPFYAVPIHLGNSGTKGGLATDDRGRVMDTAGDPIPGLYACGDVSASPMGPAYPGAGASLGPGMTRAYVCGQQATA